MNVALVWATPNGDDLIAYMARVSNPDNQGNPNSSKLIRYVIDNKHWSPFEMVGACFEIETTRDIARQILRHRSFHFQEFSQRYADVTKLGDMGRRECRMQDATNRQNSIVCTDKTIQHAWIESQDKVVNAVEQEYRKALSLGVAKEQARALLPEGLTPSRMYMHGTLRDWIHYIQVRTDEGTQTEHREIAEACKSLLAQSFPDTFKAASQ